MTVQVFGLPEPFVSLRAPVRGRPRRLPDPEPRPCERCGIEFTPIRKKHKQRFCGLLCQRAYASALRLAAAQTPEAREKQAAALRDRGACKTYRKMGGVHEHRKVMEQMLGRTLLPGEIVHHKDHNKRNNDPANLEVLTQSEHARYHFAKWRAGRKGGAP